MRRWELHRVEPWKIVLPALAAGAVIGGLIGYGLGTATPPAAPIIIQMPAAAAR